MGESRPSVFQDFYGKILSHIVHIDRLQPKSSTIDSDTEVYSVHKYRMRLIICVSLELLKAINFEDLLC